MKPADQEVKTIRDQFAIAAMTPMFPASPTTAKLIDAVDDIDYYATLAKWSYRMADAMMKARGSKETL